ncbi:MAG: TPM domain-containing protein, partial [Rhodococcus sp.]|nr:TPM domain-containing protein [Rhodococcus sp. (in: high G+C Gram-positive bacteria)]
MPLVTRLVRAAALLAVGAFLALFTLALAPAASAETPMRLPGQITDPAGVLDSSDLTDVQAAIDQLYDNERIRLWVVFVPDFSGASGAQWAERTWNMSSLGNRDALLAVATDERDYFFNVSQGLSSVTDRENESIRVDAIEPALRSNDWAAASIAAATGIEEAVNSSDGMSVGALLVGGGAIAVVAGGAVVYSRRNKAKSTAAMAETARSIDPKDTAALATLPLPMLDERAKEILIDTDDAIRGSTDELELARGEFGDQAAAPFIDAVNKARSTLGSAFQIRQRLDDA